MGHAYTPGLKVKEALLVKKQRILPLKGDVMVKVGDKVTPDDVVARIANKLGLPPEDIEMVMLKKVGDPIKAGEMIALSKTLFIFKNPAHATIDGTIESISTITGQILQRGAPSPVEVKAYLHGVVTEVFPEEGVEVQCQASFVQGIFGIGGEKSGPIHIAVDNNSVVLEEDLIDESMAGKIIIGGSLVTAGALNKANKVGVLGIVVGGFDDKDQHGLQNF
jgi:hypothetical protein